MGDLVFDQHSHTSYGKLRLGIIIGIWENPYKTLCDVYWFANSERDGYYQKGESMTCLGLASILQNM